MSNYFDLLARKKDLGFKADPIFPKSISESLFPFQRRCLQYLLQVGRGAAFLDTGLGKTIIQTEWARHIPGDVLIIAPLAVAYQTIEEAEKLIGLPIRYSKDGSVEGKVTITNYERVENFDTSRFAGVVLDESSILKGMNSKTKDMLCNLFAWTPYRLACTATPAPNDYKELGNHSEFLGIMNTNEMLTRWFVHDSANTADWRLKGHAVQSFWEWVASWAACVSRPSDLGYSDDGYNLPPLNIKTHKIETETKTAFDEGLLFDMPEVNATSLHRKRRESLEDRCDFVAGLVNSNDRPWIVWCESNDESEMLARMIPDAVEVRGSNTPDQKEERLMAFTHGKARVIVSKSSICGFGMNWQHCNDIAFASISYSYEQFYQAVRRSWRFGQKKPVNVHVVITDAEIQVWRTIERKSTDHDTMKEHMKHAIFSNAKTSEVKVDYNPQTQGSLPEWMR
jgi:superfamily II DNA or RNA helicase